MSTPGRPVNSYISRLKTPFISTSGFNSSRIHLNKLPNNNNDNNGFLSKTNSKTIGLRYFSSSGLKSSQFYSDPYDRKAPINTIIKFVPQQEAWIIERMGKFHRILNPGLAILAPFIDRIAYVHPLKEIAVEVPPQHAITQDNVTLQLTGILYYRIVDPYKASYGVMDAEYAISQLAQTTMRAEIGRMTLDKTLSQRMELNNNIVEAINTASEDWGIKCLRYEICDINPPENVVAAMHQQVSAERRKRAQILESLGTKESAINVAQGEKEAAILRSEALRAEFINKAEGDARATEVRALADAKAIEYISKAIEQSSNGQEAISLSIAENYIDAFRELAKEGNTLIVPSDVADVTGMVGRILGSYSAIVGNKDIKKTSSKISTENLIPLDKLRDESN